MIFGSGTASTKKEEKKSTSPANKKADKAPRKKSATDELMDMLAGGDDAIVDEAIVIEGENAKERKKSVQFDDDAIIVEEDDAIIVEEDEAIVAEKVDQLITKPSAAKKAEINKDAQAMLQAAKKKPLWLEENRHVYTQAKLLAAFRKEPDIDFSLFDDDYMSVQEVFAAHAQLPFNQEESLMAQVDVRRFQDKGIGGGAKGARHHSNYAAGAKGASKDKPWSKSTAQNRRDGDEEEEEDPEWIEFELGKDRTKFLGHVMEDEARMREAVLKKKENKQARAEERKKRAIEQAKMEGLTEEQRDIIAASKNEGASATVDQEKLREAEALAAQIEAESFSKYDVNFESRNYRRSDEALTDEQLADLFGEMKRETQAKREKEFKKFAPAVKADDAGELLGGLEDDDDELAGAPRGADDEELMGLIDAAGSEYKKVGLVEAYSPDKNEMLEEEPEEEATVQLFNEEFKAELAAYKEKKKQEMVQTQERTAESNLAELFSNFRVVTQQRHKVDLEAITNFSQAKTGDKAADIRGSLIASVFAQMNPFAPFVIQDIMAEVDNNTSEESKDDENGIWQLHESLFKRGPDHKVDPAHLKKSSAQMFSVYKYYENPALLVKSKHYTGKEDHVEVRDLVPKVRFFDAPDIPAEESTDFNAAAANFSMPAAAPEVQA